MKCGGNKAGCLNLGLLDFLLWKMCDSRYDTLIPSQNRKTVPRSTKAKQAQGRY